jgi:putative ABC transport system permease protein
MTRTLRRAWKRLLSSLSRRKDDPDLAEELESHIRLLTDENIRRGLPPEEARRRARIQFGGLESTKESYRDQRGLPALDTHLQDLRFASRGIRRKPGFAAVAILSLAIGIGANTTIFSLVNSVLLHPLAYHDPQRLFSVREIAPQLNNGKPMPVNPLHAREWARQCPAVEQAAVMDVGSASLVVNGEPARVPAAAVSHNLFAVLGIDPLWGRTFLPEEEQEGRDPVVILSESIWRSSFNADASLVGRSILVDGRNHQVVGVIPARFRLPLAANLEAAATGARFEIFRPLVLDRKEQARLMGNFNYSAVIRLKPGVSAAQALAAINVVQARFPPLTGSKADLKAILIPVHELVTGQARLGLWMLAAAVGAVLLIVCVNLANLLLSRLASRSRETAIRIALGAGRGRLFRQVLTETLLLALSGGALGILFAGWTVQALVATAPVNLPRLDEVRLDSGVLLFALCLTLLTGLVFGVLPAWRLARHDPQEALRAGSHTVTEGRRGMRLREGLVSLEVSLSAALLILAGLLGASLARLLQVDKGFDAARVLTVNVSLAGALYTGEASRARFFDGVLARLSALPGVQAAGVVTALPTLGETWQDPIYLEGAGRRGEERHPVNNRYASPGYFRALNIRMLSGRAFEESDRGRGVAVLSRKAAQLLWPGEPNPLGRRFIGEDDKIKTLVGILADVRASLHSDPPPTAYYPYWQRVPAGAALVVRTTADPRAALGAVRAALRGQDSQLPIPPIRTMEEVVDLSVAPRRFQLALMAVFAASALLVASLGIYGVVSYSVARRRNEIGIRMALGAQRSRLLGMVIRQGMAPVVVGLAAGVAAALLVGRAVRGLFFGVQPYDPLTIAAVTMALLVVGAAACLLPARRAAGTDVLAALRFE